ncbi:MAG: hypothetical protein AAGB14_12275, partial [Verrucomicrobiota bacterium]
MRIHLSILFALSSLGVHAENVDPELNFDRPHGERGDPEFLLNVGWESRYVSEGRDNLDGAGLITGTLEFGWEYLSLGVWYADSPSNSYNELQINAALTKSWGDFEAYVGYTHLRFPETNDGHDHEVGGGFSWSGLPYELVIAFDFYNSIDNSGTFYELSLGGEYEFCERWTFSPAIVFGMNQGYIGDGHDGANHIATSLGISYALTDSISIGAHAAYNFALDRQVARAGD